MWPLEFIQLSIIFRWNVCSVSSRPKCKYRNLVILYLYKNNFTNVKNIPQEFTMALNENAFLELSMTTIAGSFLRLFNCEGTRDAFIDWYSTQGDEHVLTLTWAVRSPTYYWLQLSHNTSLIVPFNISGT